MGFELKLIDASDNLEELVAQINQSQWDGGNAIESYTAPALKAYLEKQDTVFIVCYCREASQMTLAGMASARIELKPYDGIKWLYVDEVDTCLNLRKRGVGTALMQELFAFADENGCEEVWLGTELDNVAANALYKSLGPDDITRVIGYTYEPD